MEVQFKRTPSYSKLNGQKISPKEFTLNRKQGFSVPMDDWMRKAPVNELLDGLPKDIFNQRFIEKLINGQNRGRTNGARLFSLLMLNLSNRYTKAFLVIMFCKSL